MSNNEETKMILSVTVNNGVIETNFRAIEAYLCNKMAEYKQMVYTGEDALADMKADRAELNSLIKQIEARKKEVKATYMEPFTEFESGIKYLVGIVKETVSELDSSVKEIEENAKEERRKKIRAFYEETAAEKQFLTDPFYERLYSKIYDVKWENKTTALKTWKTVIVTAIENYLKNIELLKNMNEPEFLERAVEKYQMQLDFKDALEYISEKRRIRAEEEVARLKREVELEAAKIKVEAEVKARAEETIRKVKEDADRKATEEIERAKKEVETEIQRVHAEEENLKAEAERKMKEASTVNMKNTRTIAVQMSPDFENMSRSAERTGGMVQKPMYSKTTPQEFFGVNSYGKNREMQEKREVGNYNPFSSQAIDVSNAYPYAANPNYQNMTPSPKNSNIGFFGGYVSPEYGGFQQASFDFNSKKTCLMKIYEQDRNKVQTILQQNGIWFEF